MIVLLLSLAFSGPVLGCSASHWADPEKSQHIDKGIELEINSILMDSNAKEQKKMLVALKERVEAQLKIGAEISCPDKVFQANKQVRTKRLQGMLKEIQGHLKKI